MPDQLPVPSQSTTIYYSDGKTPMAKIGNENRTIVSLDQIPKPLRDAVVSAEDSTFYTNSGVDFKGVIRAAWNNFTGGDRQGASTITQQYARNMADLDGITYARKIREAVIAMKLSQKYSKDQILWAYLNSVYFGRGTYGVEAAAQAYFKKDAQQLTVEEDMVLASLIKQPEPNPADGTKGYDPANSLDNATYRWKYTRDQMIKGGFLKKNRFQRDGCGGHDCQTVSYHEGTKGTKNHKERTIARMFSDDVSGTSSMAANLVGWLL